ncbi:preprotein translocase subunit YajC [Propionibacterium sp.]|uniref:preprotein translocase subunit YajC n=1 Tax=Propionibacterium sp. TaxID=1977903 RepID=UPI0039EA16A3
MQGSSLIILVVVMFAAMYFLMIRPQKKQQQKQRDMLAAAKPGARVMLTSGIFGSIRAAGDKQLVIELAPGVDITVVRQAVAKIIAPEEEEFEYADVDQDAEPDEPAETSAPEGTPSLLPLDETPASPLAPEEPRTDPDTTPVDGQVADEPLAGSPDNKNHTGGDSK